MRPTRGLSSSWLNNLPRERRTALVSLGILLVLLISLVSYQRVMDKGTHNNAEASKEAPRDLPVTQSPPLPDKPVPEIIKRLMAPLEGTHKILQPFAFAFSERYGDFRLHPGVDYQASAGDSVVAAGKGTVLQIEQHPVDGTVLLLDHGNGLTTKYSGLGKVLVAENEAVQSGHVIAQVGQAAPPHLRFEVLVGGEPVNPSTYFQN